MRARANVIDVRTLDPGNDEVRPLRVHLVLDADESIVHDGAVTALDVEQTARKQNNTRRAQASVHGTRIVVVVAGREE